MQLVWLRNDLRLDDNPALYHACQRGGLVTVIYCATQGQWRQHHEAPAKLALRSDTLTELSNRLASLGIGFTLLKGDYYSDLPKQISDYGRQHHITDLWFNDDYAFNEQRRDQSVCQALQTDNIHCHRFAADSLAPTTLQTQKGNWYQVFTPWYKAWLKHLASHTPNPLPTPNAIGPPLAAQTKPIQLPGASDYRRDLWPASEAAAQQQLWQFAEHRHADYQEQRDAPALNGTSNLSPYLASGLLSPRRCLAVLQQTASATRQDWLDDPWLRQLAWRDFYRYLMINYPQLSKGQPFKDVTRHLQWQRDDMALQAWQQGQTGYPIIDAAMRQLHQCGWMHNRLRMLSASFLSKLLLIHWQQGEQYFMQQLVDGDFACNNGGWQWSASCGCDASPWFRVFNPQRQSERFDASGQFIRQMLPQLAHLDDKSLHNPSPQQRLAAAYPPPIIDYRFARQRVLQRFQQLNQNSQPDD